jgi:hypothetical protein
MEGFQEHLPSLPLYSRHRPVGQTLFLTHFPSSASLFDLLRSALVDKRIFSFFSGSRRCRASKILGVHVHTFSFGFLFLQINALAYALR